jgi:pimeloyl-ACP methyl ester carboxylesterase
MSRKVKFKQGYSDVNGLTMYYEVYGEGKPLVLIHGGGSTIQTSFGRIIPLLAKHRQIVAVELQAHGRTNDRNADLSFEQDADDVATLLNNIGITKAVILGFSNGGQTAIEIALRYTSLVNKLILCSTFYKRSAAFPEFWEGFKGEVKFSIMPQVYKNEFLRVNADQDALLNMFNKDVRRMREFKDWSEDQIRSIQAPTLVINGDADVGSPEHAVEMFRTIPDCHLMIFPGGHGEYLGEIMTINKDTKKKLFIVPVIRKFLDKQS